MRPQRLGAVDRLHHRVFGEKRSVTSSSSSLQSSLWSGSVSSPCTRPSAASPPWRPRHRCPLLIPTAGAGTLARW